MIASMNKNQHVSAICRLRALYNDKVTRVFLYMDRRNKARMKFTKQELTEEIYKLQKEARRIDREINDRITLANGYINGTGN